LHPSFIPNTIRNENIILLDLNLNCSNDGESSRVGGSLGSKSRNFVIIGSRHPHLLKV
jgi:hypothetical protein